MGGHPFIPYDGGAQGVPLPAVHRPRPFSGFSASMPRIRAHRKPLQGTVKHDARSRGSAAGVHSKPGADLPDGGDTRACVGAGSFGDTVKVRDLANASTTAI